MKQYKKTSTNVSTNVASKAVSLAWILFFVEACFWRGVSAADQLKAREVLCNQMPSLPPISKQWLKQPLAPILMHVHLVHKLID